MIENPVIRQLGIVGTGRVARALARGLGVRSQAPALIWGRARLKRQEAAERGGCSAAESLEAMVEACDVVAVAVADDAIAEIAGQIAEAGMAEGSLVFHVSGGTGTGVLDPLRNGGALTAAIHPAMTFTGDPQLEVARMAGACFAITGSSPEATRRARLIVEALGGTPIEIAETQRALYHAALCHAANHLVTMFDGASRMLRAAGVEEPSAVLAPLARAALDNSIAQGFGALSGPILRGDANTIRDHLAALAIDCPEVLPAYRAMALATVSALGDTDAARAVRSLLDE
ncbi:DUF2520 domain-containing protein [Sphingosinicella soli]|uniref:Putative short-subunit dehydrogenase-like oxidoreductase (DUF2520 family) n=1 Tax=Sphingosinicella soli TaxID=333708 RepID=A0A7W7B1S8_9SPHN|nr:putative short-subunit dehydrogenase-like oxidoreductase (DUF2520 family) [Sphingosinicella soli]